MGRDTFFADYYRKKPLHIPAAGSRAEIFSVADLNSLVSQASLWNERTLKMWADRAPISQDQIFAPVQSLEGVVRRPDPAKVEALFARGASIVLNETENMTPSLRAVANALEETLLGFASANIYCSRGGRQAFDSHYDDHEVFAFHIAGEKKWRVYEGRIDNPVGQPPPRPNLQDMHDKAKKTVLFEQVMRPGDVMYLPRGQYHDALASSGMSLHVTFSVFPMNGLALFDLMETASIRDSLFRDDLPNPGLPGGREALAERLKTLGARLAALMADPGFADHVAAAQRGRVRRRSEARLSPP
ncbi:JmjC domain-containing protein [Hyphococcus sp.]|uniref:JmjC domain-containing protein n=1 Tax=Hyphococcus sp. TaxID=2038636 RepID=UPI003D12FDE2